MFRSCSKSRLVREPASSCWMKSARSNRIVCLTLACLAICALRGPAQDERAGLDVPSVQEFSSLDRNADGALDRMEFAFSEIAYRAREIGERERVDRVFSAIDADGNGKTELLEFVRSQQNRNVRILDRQSARRFDELDSDEDGILTMGEYLESPLAQRALADGRSAEDVRQAFERIDLNASGAVGPVEWLQALEIADRPMDEETAMIFATLDANDDGAIDAEEKKKIEIEAPELAAFVQPIERIDLNGNGEIGPREFAKAQTAATPEVEKSERFILLDRNKDGAVSRREFGRGEYARKIARNDDEVDWVFDWWDSDDDGELSPAEFRPERMKNWPDFGRKGKK